MTACSHLDQIRVLDLPDPIEGCAGDLGRR